MHVFRDADAARQLTGLGFVDAVRTLTENNVGAPISPRSALAARPPSGPPPAAWQARARSVIACAVADLWSPCGEQAREWLHARGLQDEALQRWRIGYVATDRHEMAWRWGLLAGKAVYLPAGGDLVALVAGAASEPEDVLLNLRGRRRWAARGSSRVCLRTPPHNRAPGPRE